MAAKERKEQTIKVSKMTRAIAREFNKLRIMYTAVKVRLYCEIKLICVSKTHF